MLVSVIDCVEFWNTNRWCVWEEEDEFTRWFTEVRRLKKIAGAGGPGQSVPSLVSVQGNCYFPELIKVIGGVKEHAQWQIGCARGCMYGIGDYSNLIVMGWGLRLSDSWCIGGTRWTVKRLERCLYTPMNYINENLKRSSPIFDNLIQFSTMEVHLNMNRMELIWSA